jgi:hypothetical protein
VQFKKAQVEEFLDGFQQDANMLSIAVFDGLIMGSGKEFPCSSWIDKDAKSRRMIYVSSMGSEHSDPKNLEGTEIEQFFQSSWRFDEYDRAMADTEFARSVQAALLGLDHLVTEGNITPSEITSRRLWAKFYYAGGCARFMFEYTWEKVEQYLAVGYESTRKSDVAVSSSGHNATHLKNRLYKVFQIPPVGFRRHPMLIRSFLSEYVFILLYFYETKQSIFFKVKKK